jgi:hypothetical protein
MVMMMLRAHAQNSNRLHAAVQVPSFQCMTSLALMRDTRYPVPVFELGVGAGVDNDRLDEHEHSPTPSYNKNILPKWETLELKDLTFLMIKAKKILSMQRYFFYDLNNCNVPHSHTNRQLSATQVCSGVSLQ